MMSAVVGFFLSTVELCELLSTKPNPKAILYCPPWLSAHMMLSMRFKQAEQSLPKVYASDALSRHNPTHYAKHSM